MTSTALQPVEKVETVLAQVRDDDFRAQLASVLPDGVTVAKFEQVVKTALLEDISRQRDPGRMLVNADPGSLWLAAMKCANDGLMPDGRQAALVKRGDTVVYQAMVGGFLVIAAEHGWSLTGRVVCANDEFEQTEEPPAILHRPVKPGEERGAFVAAYAVARHRDGRRRQLVMDAEKIAKRAKLATTDKVWKEWPEEMWEKTAVRALFAELPLDPADKDRVLRVLQAADLDPGEAAAALYGRREPSFGMLPAGAAPYVDQASPRPSGETAEGEVPAPPTPAGASPADDFGAEVTEPAQAEAEVVAPAGPTEEQLKAAQEAAGYVVNLSNPDNWAHGKTLAQIRQDERHALFFQWALSLKDGPVKEQARAYARVQLPDLLEAA